MRKFLSDLGRCRAGTTAIEYGLIAVLVAVAAIGAFQALAAANVRKWDATAARVDAVVK